MVIVIAGLDLTVVLKSGTFDEESLSSTPAETEGRHVCCVKIEVNTSSRPGVVRSDCSPCTDGVHVLGVRCKIVKIRVYGGSDSALKLDGRRCRRQCLHEDC